jgi:clan AA aspartic protease
MIEGTIQEAGTPVLAIKVIGRGGEEVTVEGILDTGFDGFLCLPISLAVSLGLELIDVTHMELADGTIVEDELLFAGRAEWDGTVMDADILLTRSQDVLIGTAFLRGYQVRLDYPRGKVWIERLGVK